MSTENQKALSAEMLAEQLQRLREKLGEEAYVKARYDLCIDLILRENGEAFLKNVFPDFDLEPIREEAVKRAEAKRAETPGVDPASPEGVLFNMLRQQLPNLKTQAHLNTFMTAFDALRTTLDAYFIGDAVKALRAREALNKTLDMAARIHEIAQQAEEIPVEQQSEALREYVTPPKQFHEYDDQRRLLVELNGLTTGETLAEWYAANKPTMDRIVSQNLRNELFDAIRKKRSELAKKEAN